MFVFAGQAEEVVTNHLERCLAILRPVHTRRRKLQVAKALRRTQNAFRLLAIACVNCIFPTGLPSFARDAKARRRRTPRAGFASKLACTNLLRPDRPQYERIKSEKDPRLRIWRVGRCRLRAVMAPNCSDRRQENSLHKNCTKNNNC